MASNIKGRKKSRNWWEDLNQSTENSSCNLEELRCHSQEENKDHISNLPDDTIFHLLSMIPFSCALNTYGLSTRWRKLWNSTLVQNGSKEDINCAVGSLLLHFDDQQPLRHPRILQFHYSQGLVLLAAIGLKKKLHLDFSKGKQEFPRQFGWQLVLNSVDPAHQPPPRTFVVKILTLTSVSFLNNEIVSSLVSNFQSIKSLTIAKCDGLRSLHIQVTINLRSLTILYCAQLRSLKIEGYELDSFRFRGALCWFSLHGVRYLQGAMLDFSLGPGYKHFEYHHFDHLIRAIRDVEVLTVSGWIFKAIIGPWLFSGHESFRFSKLKDLWWIDNSLREDHIKSLLSFLQFCPSLQRLFINVEPSCYSLPGSHVDCSDEAGIPSRLRHLKVVKLEGCSDEEMIILNEHLLKSFQIEPRIVTAAPGKQSRCLKRIPRKQTKDRCKSEETHKGRFCYRFVEEVEDNVGLLSKHAHMEL